MSNKFLTAEQFVQTYIDTARREVDKLHPEKTDEERKDMALKIVGVFLGAWHTADNFGML